MKRTIGTIGVLTSGGDAPGMNAAIRAVVRAAIQRGLRTVGVEHGFTGLLDGCFLDMDLRSVGNILQRGGTILGTSRSPEFMTEEGRLRAADQLRRAGIDALIVIGGEGSFKGAAKLEEECGIPMMGIPATIDNDVYGTDFAIGFDTAVNTAIEAIDRLRDTAESHGRVFFVEVMGRQTGFLALEIGLAGGAMDILVPEFTDDFDHLADLLRDSVGQGRQSSIIVVSEGDKAGGVFQVADQVAKRISIDYRVAILGHIQRGGAPTARDRILGARLGAGAVHGLLHGRSGCMVGEVAERITVTPFPETWQRVKSLDAELVELMRELSG